MVLLKLVGWGCLLFGGLMIIAFPFTRSNQPIQMATAGVIFGIIMISIGLLLIKL